MRISDWSSDVCSSDLMADPDQEGRGRVLFRAAAFLPHRPDGSQRDQQQQQRADGNVPRHQRLANPVLAIGNAVEDLQQLPADQKGHAPMKKPGNAAVAFFGIARSEEHTSELQSLMRISYAVFCLKQKK